MKFADTTSFPAKLQNNRAACSTFYPFHVFAATNQGSASGESNNYLIAADVTAVFFAFFLNWHFFLRCSIE